MSKIYDPHIYLFAYHSSTAENSNLLYEKCDEILNRFGINNFNLKQRVNLHTESENVSVELLEENTVITGTAFSDFEGNIALDGKDINFIGTAYPLRIHDSYALALNFHLKDKDNQEVDTTFLGQFNQENSLLLDTIQSSLGQSIIITAKPQQDDALDNLAKECLNGLISNYPKKAKLVREGELFGSPIFEYRLAASHRDYQYILVWLITNEETERIYTKLYPEFIELLLEYNTIVQCYWQRRQIDDVLDQRYVYIDQKISKFEEMTFVDSLNEDTLKLLQQKLKSLAKTASEYTHWLRKLEEQRHLMSMSSRSYTKQLKSIQQKIEDEFDSGLGKDLSFLDSYKQTFQEYQEKINADVSNFVPRFELLSQAIASIRGVVEIEQAIIDRAKAKHDKRLANRLTVIGTGATSASLVTAASVLSAQSAPHIEAIEEIPPVKEFLSFLGLEPEPGKKDLADSIVAIGFSLIVGLVFGIVTWLMIKSTQTQRSKV
jgi:hypothetical protein